MPARSISGVPYKEFMFGRDHVFKIGYGPNALINLAPYRACRYIAPEIRKMRSAHHVRACLYNELARTAVETRVINDVKRGLKHTGLPAAVLTNKKPDKPIKDSLALDVCVYTKYNKLLKKYRIISTGAGSYSINGVQEKKPVYDEPFARSLEWLTLHPKTTYLHYLTFGDGEDVIREHYLTCIKIMDKIIDEGLKASKPSPDLTKIGIVYKPRAKTIYENKRPNETVDQRMIRKISAYSFAISETIPLESKQFVASPTGSTSPVVWAVLRYLREEYKPTEDQIVQALSAAALIYANMRFLLPISSYQGGCQSAMACATAMATAVTCVILYDAKYDEIGRACEMAIEHIYGLICNSVCAVPLVPCVERAASFAVRAYELAVLNHSLMGTKQLVRFDDAVMVLTETGKDLNDKWKKAGFGGFAETARYSLFPKKSKKGGK